MSIREIKFRAWHRQYKKWHYFNIPGDMFRVAFRVGEETVRPSGLDYEHWGQYTGLNDKNGKEIYEGDIVAAYIGKEYEQYWFIKYLEGHAAFWMWLFDKFKTGNGPRAHLDLNHYRDIEAVGNIYENPELLEGSHA